MPRNKIEDVRSEEVQEVLSQIPGWIIRWGITVIFVSVGLLLIASWFIKYPDTISAKVIITTESAPATMIARSNGRLLFFSKDQQKVKEGDFLAAIENPANIEDVFYLINKFNNPNMDFRKLFSLSPDSLKENLNLGSLQNSYIEFISLLKSSSLYKQLNFYEKQINIVQSRINNYRQLNLQLKKQNDIVSQELALSKKKYTIDSMLLKQKVISELTFDESKNNYLQKKRIFESAIADMIDNQISTSQLEANLLELNIQQQEKEANLINEIKDSFKTLKNELEKWKEQYLIEAPIDGKVALSNYWSNNQFIQEGEELMTIIPNSTDIFGYTLMPISGSGKVEVGQRVNIRFENYPSHEYGMVTGEVESIGLLPKDEVYTVRIGLPNGLITSYGKKLSFRHEMQGSAEIVTQNKRLISRIFNRFKSLIDRPN
ncbi:hemolysin [Marivirga lumbricoides]|uniref:Hemolysin n=1 Tax=Marivirga lumbricoides TaxID=1046115 RepID=A0ABQ1N8L8_9BACT|nr:hemolysin [Marivirga lumbricoides]